MCLTWFQGTGKWNLVLNRSCTTCKISNFSINRHLTSIISNPPHLKMRGTGPTHSFCLVQGTPGQVSTTKTLHLTNGAVFARTQQQPDERLCSFEGIPTRKRSRYLLSIFSLNKCKHPFCRVSVKDQQTQPWNHRFQWNIFQAHFVNDVSSQGNAEKIIAHHPICLAIEVT